jgi:transposase InsO family protein
LLRDCDGSYGEKFSEAAEWLGTQEVLTAPQSPWQNAYVERLIGSIRRECLDHVIILHESGLRRMLRSYFESYPRSRTHLGLARMRPSRVPCNRTNWVELWGSHKWEDFTTDTNDGQPERVPSSPYLYVHPLIGQTCFPA